MSLILEALRKSEAERRSSSLPGLVSQTTASFPAPRRARPWLVWLPLVLLAGLGIGWWLPRWLSAPEPASPAAAPPALDAPPVATPSPPPESPSVIPSPAPATGAAVPQGAAPAATPAPAVSAPAAAPPPPAAPPRSEPAAVVASMPSLPDAGNLAQMPAGQRQQLPPLKLTVHVYNPDPERRFAIVDGRRVSDGAALGQGVTLREVRREGLLLDVSGQPWLLERGR